MPTLLDTTTSQYTIHVLDNHFFFIATIDESLVAFEFATFHHNTNKNTTRSTYHETAWGLVRVERLFSILSVRLEIDRRSR